MGKQKGLLMKKLIAIFLGIMMISVSAFGISPVQAASLCEGSVTADELNVDRFLSMYDERAEKLRNAREAYYALYDSFSKTRSGGQVYPDGFAGAWLEGSKLYVAMTSFDNAYNIRNSLSGYSCVEYVSATYSLNQLNTIWEATFNQVKDIIQIGSTYVDVKTNSIVFNVLTPVNEAKQIITNNLSLIKNVVPDNDKLIVNDKMFTVNTGSMSIPQANIYGGTGLRKGSSSGGRYTVGMCGTIKLSMFETCTGIVTAGHSMTTSGTNKNMYRGSSVFGETVKVVNDNYLNGDFALVKMTSSDTLTNKIYGTSSSNTRSITGTNDSVAVGDVIMKYGYVSGYCTGTVTAINATVNQNGTYITGITFCSLDSGKSAGGDSGGPYYIQGSGSSYSFVGVHMGVNSAGTELHFTPYGAFRSYFIPFTN